MATNINPTLYPDIISKYLPVLVDAYRKKLAEEGGKKYLFMQMAPEKLTGTLSWNASDVKGAVAMADVVSMDSQIPLKKRQSIRLASGDIPKLGVSYALKESDIKNIQVIVASGASTAQVAKELLDNVPNAVTGILDLIETMWLKALSTGATEIGSPDLEGQTIRADFGVPEENNIKPATKWGQSGATPLKDIQSIFDKAEAGNKSIGAVLIDRKTLDALRNSEDGKILYGRYKGLATNVKNIATGTRAELLEALQGEFEVPFYSVNNTAFNVQKEDGTVEAIKPWTEGNIVAIPSFASAGTLFYSPLVEETRPLEGVITAKPNNYTLLQSYSEVNPYREVLTATAFAFPALNNGSSVYILHTAEVA